MISARPGGLAAQVALLDALDSQDRSALRAWGDGEARASGSPRVHYNRACLLTTEAVRHHEAASALHAEIERWEGSFEASLEEVLVAQLTEALTTVLQDLVGDPGRHWHDVARGDAREPSLALDILREVHRSFADASADAADGALRELRIALTTSDAIRWARSDPSLVPLRTVLDRKQAFDRVLGAAGSPLLADLPPFANELQRFAAAGITTPAQLAAVCRIRTERDALLKTRAFKGTSMDDPTLLGLARFAWLVHVIRGDTATAAALWSMNVRSTTALADPTLDLVKLSGSIATDQLGWPSGVLDLLTAYRTLATDDGPDVFEVEPRDQSATAISRSRRRAGEE